VTLAPDPLRFETCSLRRQRLLARLPRLLSVLLVAVLALAGLRVIVFGAHVSARAPVPERTAVDLAAHGLAAEVVRRYLSWDAEHPERRIRSLSGLAGPLLGEDLGLTPPPQGAQRVRWAQVVQDQEAIAGGRLVTVAAMTDARGLLHVSVPLRRDGSGRLVLAGYPAVVGGPLIDANAPAPVRRTVTDPGLRRVAARAVENYLAGDAEDLQADLAPGAKVALPGLALDVTDTVEIADLGPDGALVTVRARGDDGAVLTLAYELGIARAERWYVTAVQTFPDQP
jgi:hypothetical protein